MNAGARGQAGSTDGAYRTMWEVLFRTEGSEKKPVTPADRADEFNHWYRFSVFKAQI